MRLMRLVAAVAALLRRLRAERSVAVLLFVLVGVTSFAVAAGPRLFNAVADEGLRYEARRASAARQNLQFTRADRLSTGRSDPFERVVARGVALAGQVPESVRALVDLERYVVDAPRFRVANPPIYTTFITPRFQDGLDGELDLIGGRWPGRVEPAGPTPDDPDPLPRIEMALSDDTMTATGLATGDLLTTTVDAGDPLLREVFPRPTTRLEIEIVGQFTVRDPGARLWNDDRGLGEITVGGTEENPIAYATGLFAPEAYTDVLALDLPMRYRWRMFIDVERLDASVVGALVPDLLRLESSFVSTGAIRGGSTLLRTGLVGIVDGYLAQRGSSEAALSVAALGPLTIATGAVGLVAFLIVRRRRAALALARGRGASGGQLLATQLWEGLLISVPAAVLGLVVADGVVAGRTSTLSATGAILVALVATALLLASTWPLARRARRELEREDPAVVRLSPRRLVFESLVVGLSLAAAWLLRDRGVAGSGTDLAAGPDPFLAAAPLLVGIAVALLTIRLYPLPVRALGWLTARRPDLVPVLGLRNLGRHPTSGYLPLLILLLTVAIGTFSSVVQASIERSQREVAWQAVGADYRIETAPSGSLAASIDPPSIAGVEAVAGGRVNPDATLSISAAESATVQFLAVEQAAYDAVLTSAPPGTVAPDWPAWFIDPPAGPDTGSEADPIPAIISTRPLSAAIALAVGDTFELGVRGQAMTFRVAATAPAFPGIARDDVFVVAPFASIAAAWQGPPLQPNVLFVRGADGLDARLRALIPGEPGDPATARLVSRGERYATMHDAPLVGAVTGGFAVALLVAGVYAALAVVAVVVLHAQRRAREVTFLRTLGLTERQAAGLMVVEQGVPVVLALGIGVTVGIGLAWLLAPGIDLAAFSSPSTPVALEIDWRSVGGVALTVVLVVAVAVALSSWVVRRLDLGRALRTDEP